MDKSTNEQMQVIIDGAPDMIVTKSYNEFLDSLKTNQLGIQGNTFIVPIGKSVNFNNGVFSGAVITGNGSFIDGKYLLSATITAESIKDASITGEKIATGTITATNIANATITSTQISNTAGITGNQIANATISGSNIATGTITANNIQDATITGGKIAATTITGGNIVNATITGSKIAEATITGSNISGTAGITGSQLANATITATQIANSTITGSNIATGTITANNIATATITATQIANGTITSSQIANATIIATNISDTAGILGSQLSSTAGIVGTQIANSTITGQNISNNSINIGKCNIPTHFISGTFTNNSPSAGKVSWSGVKVDFNGNTYSITNGNTDKKYIWWDYSVSTTTFQTSDTLPTLANEDCLVATNTSGTHRLVWRAYDVNGDQIQTAAITGSHIANNTITGGNIANSTITAANIANATITGSNIANNTISGSNLVNNTITATQIQNATITTTQISNTAGITGNQIANATITASNIATGTITATNIKDLTITADQIANATITTDKICTLSVDKLIAGTLKSQTITLGITDGEGDSVIKAGKIDFGDTVNSGFILGIDDSDSNRAKFEIGDSSQYLKYDPANGIRMRSTKDSHIIEISSDPLKIRFNDGTYDRVLIGETATDTYGIKMGDNTRYFTYDTSNGIKLRSTKGDYIIEISTDPLKIRLNDGSYDRIVIGETANNVYGIEIRSPSGVTMFDVDNNDQKISTADGKTYWDLKNGRFIVNDGITDRVLIGRLD